jgi:Na+/pantothenate symporter
MFPSVIAAILLNIVLFLISLLVFRIIKNKSIEKTMKIWTIGMFSKFVLLLLFIFFLAKPLNLLTSAFGITFGICMFVFLMIEIILLNNQKI